METLGLQHNEFETILSAMSFIQIASTIVVVSIWALAGVCLILEWRSNQHEAPHAHKH